LFFSVAAVFSVFILAYCVTRHFSLSLGSALFLAVDPHFAKFAFSGMETSLAISLVMVSLYMHLTDLMSQKRWRYGASIALAVATLTRPECFLLFVACLVDRLLKAPSKERFRVFSYMSAVYLIIVAPWWFYAWRSFGTIIPNTAVAKSTTTLAWWLSARGSVISTLQLLAASYVPVLLFLLMGWGKVWLTREKHPQPRFPFAAVLWCVAWIGVQVFKGVDIVARYVLLVSPLLAVAAFEGVGHFWRTLPRKDIRLFVLLSFVSLFILNSAVLTGLLIRPAAVEFTRGFETAYIEMGQWLADNTPPDATVAVADIGAIGYFSHRTVYDLAGLVTPEAIPYMGNPGHFVEMVRPDYLIIRRMGTPPVVEEWGMSCVHATPIVTRTFHAVGSRTLGIPQFSVLYELSWLSPCSE